MERLFVLELYGTEIVNLEPIENLTHLRQLGIGNTKVSDLTVLKKLKDLQMLNIIKCENITDEKIADLKRALPNLVILE